MSNTTIQAEKHFANQELKAEIKNRNIKIYEIAHHIGVTEQKLYRAMSKPLNSQQEEAIKKAMDYISSNRTNPDAVLF